MPANGLLVHGEKHVRGRPYFVFKCRVARRRHRAAGVRLMPRRQPCKPAARLFVRCMARRVRTACVAATTGVVVATAGLPALGRAQDPSPTWRLEGCDDRSACYPVQVRVLVAGKPATDARVALIALVDQALARLAPHAEVGADGTFGITTFRTGDGAPVGRFALTLTWPPPRPGMEVGTDRFKRRYADPLRLLGRVENVAGDNDLGAMALKGSNAPAPLLSQLSRQPPHAPAGAGSNRDLYFGGPMRVNARRDAPAIRRRRAAAGIRHSAKGTGP